MRRIFIVLGVLAVVALAVGLFFLSGKSPVPANTGPKAPSTSGLQVIAVSDIPTYTLKVERHDELVAHLNRWAIFNKPYNLGKRGSTIVPLTKITVHLTDQMQAGGKVSSPKDGVYLSSDIKASRGALDVYIYVLPKLLQPSGGQYVHTQFLSTMWGLRPIDLHTYNFDAENKKLESELTTLSKQGAVYFNVTSK